MSININLSCESVLAVNMTDDGVGRGASAVTGLYLVESKILTTSVVNGSHTYK